MNLNKLIIFKTLYESGTTSKAANALHVTRSAISQNLTKLETELGVQLFIRSPKGLIPTSTAHHLATHVGPHLDEINYHVDALVVNPSGRAGTLHIGAPPATGTLHMPKIIEAFSQHHPDADIRLTLAHSRELVEMILNGRLDLALIDVYGGVTLQNDFHAICSCEPVVDEVIVMVCSPEYLQSNLTKGFSYDDLCKQRFLSTRQNVLEIRSWFHHQFGRSPARLRRKVISENSLVVLDCACRGLGLCVFGSNVTQGYVNQGRLVEIHMNSRGEKNQISLIQLLDRTPGILEKEFINILKSYAEKEWINGIGPGGPPPRRNR